MRSILLQSRPMSIRALLLPRLSWSSASSLPRRLNSFTPPSEPPNSPKSSVESPASSPPPVPQLLPTPNPSFNLPTSSRLPPLLRVPTSTPSPRSTTTAKFPSSKSPKSYWLSQIQAETHQARAVALAARYEAEGSDAVVGTPEFVKEVRILFKKVSNLLGASDDHLRALSSIHQAFLTSPAVVEDAGLREWIRKHTRNLLSLFSRRRSLKFGSLLPSLRLILHSGPDDLDLTITRDPFRLLAVGLTSGATNASEAVEIVEGLRRSSPSSFTEVEYEELLQAIGRVEDWTTTTQHTFLLPSFPAPLPPLPPHPRQTSSSPIKQLTTPAPKPISANRTASGESTSSFSPSIEKSLFTSPPSSSSSSNPLTAPSSSPTSINSLPSTPSSPPSSSSVESKVAPSPSPTSSSNNPKEQELLEFSRILSSGPPPTLDNLRYLHDSYTAVFKQPRSGANTVKIEVASHILTYASRTPRLPPRDRYSFAGVVSLFVGALEEVSLDNPSLLSPDVRKDVSSLIGRMAKRTQVNSLARLLYKNQRRDFEEEELKDIFDARERLPVDDPHIKALKIDQDWEKGLRTRLGEMMGDASSSSGRLSSDTFSHDTDADWVEQSRQALHQKRYLGRGVAYGLLQSQPIQAPSSSESLVVASELYSSYAQTAKGLPLNWRQHGDSIVRILLLFSKHQGETPPPFNLLEPVLRHLHLLPPSFIPSTPSFPSLAIPLLPMATNLNESLFIVNSVLHAQELDPIALPTIWSTFLSSVERHSTSPSAKQILGSQLFKLVQARTSSEENRTGPTPLEDVVQMYLRRVENAEGEGAKGEEMKGLEELEKLLIQRDEGKEASEKVLGELRRVLKEGKVRERV